MRIAQRNVGAAIAIVAVLVLAQFTAPPSHHKEARLTCSGSGLTMPFENMKACSASPDYRVGCGCAPIANGWADAYHYGLVPLLTALAGLVALRGALRTRLLMLNGAIVLYVLGALVAGIWKHDSNVMLIPLVPVLAAFLCALATGWFLLLRFGYGKLRRSHAN